MNIKELDDKLDHFRERIIQLANGSTHSEQMKNSLSGVADKLEAAQDDHIPRGRSHRGRSGTLFRPILKRVVPGR